jgi:hypothetical protein
VTRDDITALRLRACNAIAALGDVLDSLTVIEETVRNPSDDFADAVVIAQHLDEARTTAADLCEVTATLSVGVDMARSLQLDRIAELERGAK